MTLDEAIKYAEEKAIEQEEYAKAVESRWGSDVKGYSKHAKCAIEKKQLAEWLKELKAYREQDKAVTEAIEQGAVWDSKQHNWLEQIKKHTQNFSNFTSSACRMCSNNPANGDSGICYCILGISPIS